MSKIRHSQSLGKEDRDAQSEATTMLVGYQGTASQAGKIRLYPVLGDHSQYLEFDESAIVQAEKIPESVLPNNGFYVWVQLGSPVSWVRNYPTFSALVADFVVKAGINSVGETHRRLQ